MKIRGITCHIWLAVALILPGGLLHGQIDIADKEWASTSFLGEKVFVHTDRDLYLPGEFLWYSLYLTDDQQLIPSSLSKVAYVELLKGENPVLQQSIQVKEGLGNGSFYLPLSLESGNYTLRAYTNWMKNKGADHFFSREIKVINTLQAAFIPPQPKPEYTIRLFPEGGKLVKRIESKVAVWVTDQQHRGTDFTGVLLCRQDTLELFSSRKFGMSHFYLKPDSAWSSYRLEITIADSTYSVALPEIQERGVVMQVEDRDDSLFISVRCNPPSLLDNAYLLAHTRRQLRHVERLEIVLGETEFLLPKSLLGEGVSCLSLMDKDKNAYCERLYFKPPSDHLDLSSSTSAGTIGKREAVFVNIQAATNSSAHLSMAVFKKDELNASAADNILSYLWLSSDLDGAVESPDYYFSSNPDVEEQTDLLMLTQGWRTFKWDSILQSPSRQFRHLPEYEGSIIHIRITDLNASWPEAQVLLTAPGRHFKVAHSHIGDNGQLLFVSRGIFGPSRLLLQPYGLPEGPYHLEISSPYSGEFGRIKQSPLFLSQEHKTLLEERSLGMQVENIYTGEKRNLFRETHPDTLPFYGFADKSYLLDDYTRFPTMQEVMTEYVPEVTIRRENDQPVFRVLHNGDKGFHTREPLIILDGIAVQNTSKLLEIDPLKIRKMDIIQDRFVLGKKVYHGVVSYTTYDGDTEWWTPNETTWQTEYQGLAEQRVFYSPDHTNTNKRLPDFRSLLYWNSDVELRDGKVQVEFFTSDITGEFTGVIQGISKDGKAGFTTINFTVSETTQP